jgi:hypothetical protein
MWSLFALSEAMVGHRMEVKHVVLADRESVELTNNWVVHMAH